MRIAVTSQNFKSVTGHAGKSRRFIVFNAAPPADPVEVARLDLPLEMAMHEFTGGAHPLDEMDLIITASAGQGFVAKMAQRGVQVIACGESDPHQAVLDYLDGMVKPPAPHVHAAQEQHGHGGGSGCCEN